MERDKEVWIDEIMIKFGRDKTTKGACKYYVSTLGGGRKSFAYIAYGLRRGGGLSTKMLM